MRAIGAIGASVASGCSHTVSKAWNLVKPTDQKIHYLVLGLITGYQCYVNGPLTGLGGMAAGALTFAYGTSLEHWGGRVASKLYVSSLDTLSTKLMLAAGAAFLLQKHPVQQFPGGFAVSLCLGWYAAFSQQKLNAQVTAAEHQKQEAMRQAQEEIKAKEAEKQKQEALQQQLEAARQEKEHQLEQQRRREEENERLWQPYRQLGLKTKQIEALFRKPSLKKLFDDEVQNCENGAASLFARWVLKEIEKQEEVYRHRNGLDEKILLAPFHLPNAVQIVNLLHQKKISMRFAKELTLKCCNSSFSYYVDRVGIEYNNLKGRITRAIIECYQSQESEKRCIVAKAYREWGRHVARDLAKRFKRYPDKSIESIIEEATKLSWDSLRCGKYSRNHIYLRQDFAKNLLIRQQNRFGQVMNDLYRQHLASANRGEREAVNKLYRVEGVNEKKFKQIMRYLMTNSPECVARHYHYFEIKLSKKTLTDWQPKAIELRYEFSDQFNMEVQEFAEKEGLISDYAVANLKKSIRSMADIPLGSELADKAPVDTSKRSFGSGVLKEIVEDILTTDKTDDRSELFDFYVQHILQEIKGRADREHIIEMISLIKPEEMNVEENIIDDEDVREQLLSK